MSIAIRARATSPLIMPHETKRWMHGVSVLLRAVHMSPRGFLDGEEEEAADGSPRVEALERRRGTESSVASSSLRAMKAMTKMPPERNSWARAVRKVVSSACAVVESGTLGSRGVLRM